MRTRRQAKDISLTENNVAISAKKELAELFNRYFVHIVKMMVRTHKNITLETISVRTPAIVKENGIKVTTHNSK